MIVMSNRLLMGIPLMLNNSIEQGKLFEQPLIDRKHVSEGHAALMHNQL